MTNFFENVRLWIGEYVELSLPRFSTIDLIEILIISFFIYHIIIWFKKSSAYSIVKGLLVVLGFFALAAVFEMNTIVFIGKHLANIAITLLIVVFQPELRKALEKLGGQEFLKNFKGFGDFKNSGKKFKDFTIISIVSACFEMGAVKTGALIVIENETELSDCEGTGIPLDATVSRQLLINIFEKNTPLHDGAIIVRGDKIVAATCYLPLTNNTKIDKGYGTRHRAALGISEVSDSLTIIVSEETGRVSIAKEGKLTSNVTEEQLQEALRKIQLPDDAADLAPRKGFFRKGGAE